MIMTERKTGLVSVIIPVFNGERLLRAALDAAHALRLMASMPVRLVTGLGRTRKPARS